MYKEYIDGPVGSLLSEVELPFLVYFFRGNRHLYQCNNGSVAGLLSVYSHLLD